MSDMKAGDICEIISCGSESMIGRYVLCGYSNTGLSYTELAEGCYFSKPQGVLVRILSKGESITVTVK